MNTGIHTGAITGYFDVAQIVLYAFWIFFAGLLIYLHRENKREGYPLESDRSGGRIQVQGFPAIPEPKTYLMREGELVHVPRVEHDDRPLRARPIGSYPGAPLQPTGNGMLDGVGPAAWALRATHPDHTVDGRPMIVPLRVDASLWVSREDPDPRGMPVYGADRGLGGHVTDVWVDRAEPQIRYLELRVAAGEVAPGAAHAAAGRQSLLPIGYAKIDGGRREIRVKSILGAQFANVPTLASPDQITMREEDQIMAYFAGGYLYATPARAEPLL